MSSTSRRMWFLMIGAAASAAVAACGGSSGPTSSPGSAVPATTRVEMVVKGGFAYVYENQQLDIAYLNSTTGPCTVTQVGHRLRVTDGQITSPNPPATKEFDLQGTVVSFPAMKPDGSVTALGVGRPNTPFHPVNPGSEPSWRDLKWVPYVRPNYSGSVNENWRTLPVVDGRMVLTDGKITGGQPGDLGATNGMYRFQRASDTLTFDQAITDRTLYSVQLPGSQVVINLTKGGTTTQVVIVPPGAGQPVKLALVGLHDNSPATPSIAHFCAFYELMDPVPPMSQRLIPTFINPTTGLPCTGTTTCGPDPGAFCPGEWF